MDFFSEISEAITPILDTKEHTIPVPPSSQCPLQSRM
jgi:hypothetical protein